MKKININDPKAWQTLDWDATAQPELLKKTDNQVELARKTKFLWQNDQYRNKVINSQIENKKNKDYLEHRSNKSLEMWSDESFQKKMSGIHTNKWADEIFYNKQMESRKNRWNKKSERLKFATPIITPEGAFPSIKDAGQHYNIIRNFTNGVAWVRNQCKKNTVEFYLISKEEYIMLTGEDPFNE